MEKKKLNLDALSVTSFTTTMSKASLAQTIKGGLSQIVEETLDTFQNEQCGSVIDACPSALQCT